jgi:hypothetical protein
LKVKNLIPRNRDRQRLTMIGVGGTIFGFKFSKKYDLPLLLTSVREFDCCRASIDLQVSMPTPAGGWSKYYPRGRAPCQGEFPLGMLTGQLIDAGRLTGKPLGRGECPAPISDPLNSRLASRGCGEGVTPNSHLFKHLTSPQRLAKYRQEIVCITLRT